MKKVTCCRDPWCLDLALRDGEYGFELLWNARILPFLQEIPSFNSNLLLSTFLLSFSGFQSFFFLFFGSWLLEMNDD